ncbi:hypothetical protein D3C85_1625210 [compost metagenome]
MNVHTVKRLAFEASLLDKPAGWNFNATIRHVVGRYVGILCFEVAQLPIFDNGVLEEGSGVG